MPQHNSYDEMRELYRGSPHDNGEWEQTHAEIVADMMTPIPRPPWYKRWWTTARCFVRYVLLGRSQLTTDALIFRRGLEMGLDDYRDDDPVRKYLSKVESASKQRISDLEANYTAHPEQWELVKHFPVKGFKRTDVDAAIGLDFMHFYFIELPTQDDAGNHRLTLMRKSRHTNTV